MFYLYHSNDLELLKGLMLEQIKREPLSLFEKENILVQSQGMAHWLKLQLAQGLGVAAQVDFPLPSSFIWQVFNKLKPELPERSHFDKQIMAWKLMRLLPELAKQPECAAIAQYLELTGEQFKPLKCYQLAQNIADVFDRSQGILARLKYKAKLSLFSTTFTTLGLKASSALAIGVQMELMPASGWSIKP